MNHPTVDHIASADGTKIACWRSGAGKALVCIHGIMVDHSHWDAVRPLLQESVGVVAIDRRGHGSSEPGPASHSLADEVGDLAAVIAACEGRVDVLGHSYGGLVALEAATLGLPIDRLVVYEPSIDDDPQFPDVLARVTELVERGQKELATETLLIERTGLPADQVEAVHALALWPILLEGVEYLPREGRAILDYRFRPERFADLRIPTLVLVGEQSPAYRHDAVRALDEALPHSELRVLAGQEHVAAQTAPDLLAAEILRFLGT
jgi:pimeloyl-ACP methyl ester carboxylesterase